MIHREGYPTIVIASILIGIIGYWALNLSFIWQALIFIFLFLAFIFFINFFRNPSRPVPPTEAGDILCPADGKIVVLEEVREEEFLGDERLLVSIFMSPLNVHVNRHPIDGIIEYYKYHHGKYLVAWNPKSSTENERTTTVYCKNETKILVRQVAGALARRIVNYAKVGQKVSKGDELGFIKLGSRVDIYMPLNTKVNVKIGQVVRGNVDVIGRIVRT